MLAGQSKTVISLQCFFDLTLIPYPQNCRHFAFSSHGLQFSAASNAKKEGRLGQL